MDYSTSRLEWELLLEDEIEILGSLFFPTGTNASQVPYKHANGWVEWLDVVTHSGSRMVGISDDGRSYPLRVDQVAILRLNIESFLNSLCVALDIRPASVTTGPTTCLRLIGEVRVNDLVYRVFVAQNMLSQSFADVVRMAQAREVAPIIVLTLNAHQMSDAISEKLSSQKIFCVDIYKHVSFTAEHMCRTTATLKAIFTSLYHAHTGDRSRGDGYYPPDTLQYLGHVYKCRLSRREQAFINGEIDRDSIPVDYFFNPQDGLIEKRRSVNNARQRNALSKFLSDLNNKLSGAKLPATLRFKLPRNSDHVVRQQPR